MRCAVSFQQTRVEGNPANIHWHIPPEDYITEHQTAHKWRMKLLMVRHNIQKQR